MRLILYINIGGAVLHLRTCGDKNNDAWPSSLFRRVLDDQKRRSKVKWTVAI